MFLKTMLLQVTVCTFFGASRWLCTRRHNNGRECPATPLRAAPAPDRRHPSRARFT